LRAFGKTEPERLPINACGRRSIPSGGFLRRQPGQVPLGARGMYQRSAGLKRAAGHLFRFLWRSGDWPRSGL